MLTCLEQCLRSDMTESKPKLIAVLRRFVLRLMPMLLVLGSTALGDSAAFDLPGPRIEVKVTRGGKTLPIFESVTTRSHHLFGFHLLEGIRAAKYTVDGGARGMREVFRSASWPPMLWA